MSAKYREANIPLIAIEIPHPGATYFGANNYEAGLIGGRYLGRWAKQQWQSNVDEIVLITLERAGSLPRMRLTGMLVGMRETCPHLENVEVTYVEGDGKMGDTFEAMRRHLRTSKAKHMIVGAINDPSALGALRAFQEAGRTSACAIMGQNASPEGRAELRQAGHSLDRFGGLFSREVRVRDHWRGARHSSPPAGAAGRLREASVAHGGERQPRLPQRRVDARCR